MRDYQFGIPVLLFAIAIPVIWSLVGAARAVGDDPAGLHGLTWTMQEASRFAYLLLYFPLLDARRLFGSRGVDVWLFPVLALCVVTLLLFLSHYLIGHPGNTPSFLIFKGVFGYNPGASGSSSATRSSSSQPSRCSWRRWPRWALRACGSAAWRS